MTQPQLDYFSVSPIARPWRVRIAVIVVIALVIAANELLWMSLRSDFDWGPVIFTLGGPFLNMLLIGVFLTCTPLVRRLASGARVWPYVLAAYLLPAVAILADVVIIYGF